MEQFEVLQRYLGDKKDLAVAPKKNFTVTYGGNEITVEYVYPDYIHFYAENGTPNDMFKIKQAEGQSATFSSVTTTQSFANASLLADHITDVFEESFLAVDHGIGKTDSPGRGKCAVVK